MCTRNRGYSQKIRTALYFKNLSKLKNAGIIKDRKKGLNVYYSIAMQCAADFVQRLNNAL